MYITSNFTLEELYSSTTALKNNIDNRPDTDACLNLTMLCFRILQPIRDKFGEPIKVNSGYRCQRLNTLIGGAKTSQHLKGEAADITCRDNKKLFNLIKNMIDKKDITVGQLINEYNYKWIHISLPNDKHKNEIFDVKK